MRLLGGHKERFNRDPLPVFFAGGPCKQLWHEQGCPLFDVVHPAFPPSTMASPTKPHQQLKPNFSHSPEYISSGNYLPLDSMKCAVSHMTKDSFTGYDILFKLFIFYWFTSMLYLRMLSCLPKKLELNMNQTHETAAGKSAELFCVSPECAMKGSVLTCVLSGIDLPSKKHRTQLVPTKTRNRLKV